MNVFKLTNLLAIALLVVAVVGVQSNPVTSTTPAVPSATAATLPATVEIIPGTSLPVPPSAELSSAEQTRRRLSKIWSGGDVGVIDNALASSGEDIQDMAKRFNKKYGVFDPLFDATKLQSRQDVTSDMSSSVITKETLTDVQSDYKSIYKTMSTKKIVNPVEDDPASLESHLGSLWGKRYAHMSDAVRQDTLRNDNVLVIQGTSPEARRQSMGISTDGSVQSWVAHAESVEDDAQPAQDDKPFKPESFWYGPRVVSDALDVTKEELNGHGRQPSEPPKPPVESFVFAEPLTAEGQDPENKITIIERITVTKPGSIGGKSQSPEPTFTPIMVDKVNGQTQRAFIH